MWKKVAKKFAIIAILLFVTSLAFADSDVGYSNYPKITRIEKQLYNQSYENEDIYLRLDRLEKTLHKITNPDLDLASRVENLLNELQISAMPGYLLKDIEYMENSNFSKIFKSDTPDNRLERLEYHLIGAVQDGNYKDRIFKLKSLNDNNNVAQYFDANSDLYNPPPTSSYSDEVVAPTVSKMEKIQNVFFMLAPFLLGLL
jgi:hypothetical protein